MNAVKISAQTHYIATVPYIGLSATGARCEVTASPEQPALFTRSPTYLGTGTQDFDRWLRAQIALVGL